MSSVDEALVGALLRGMVNSSMATVVVCGFIIDAHLIDFTRNGSRVLSWILLERHNYLAMSIMLDPLVLNDYEAGDWGWETTKLWPSPIIIEWECV